MMGVGMKIKKVVIFPLKICYRSICNHLVLVGFLFFLVFLYRSFPFIFSMLVSASPVVVCTLVLLGALLCFGKPNVPDIELDHREAHEVVLLKAAFSDDSSVERNESVPVEKCSDKGKDMEEKSTERTSEIVNDTGKDDLDGSSFQMVEKISRDIELDDRVQEEGKKGSQGFKLKKRRKMLGERHADRRFMDKQYSLITDDTIDDDNHSDEENGESLVGSVDSTEVNVDNSDSPPGSPWKHVDEEQGDEDDGEVLDSGSDRAESSSPDASIAEITPILDELHPLLDEEASQAPNLSSDGSDAYSELSVTSNDSSSELDDDSDDNEELEVAEDDDEEEINEDDEDQTKCAITWTEEDQKNLMDLGTSELERNKRLENLIARRGARRCMTTVTEKNLIDLDMTDPTFRVPPISTTRTNPFDLNQGSYENMGTPPIPGSAPSALLPLKNPFDIPYDSSQVKPVHIEGSYQREFMPLQSKDPFFRRHDSFNVQPSSSPLQSRDPFFRRHESFNVQPSSFGMDGTEKQFMGRHRPYFVSERLGSEGTSFVPIHRQSSEVSDSKTSSVTDTDSFSSTGEMEEQDGTEEEVSFIDAEGYISPDPELISTIDDASVLVGHGSESSDEDDSIELGRVEKRQIKVDEIDMKLEDVDNHKEIESSIKAEGNTGNQLEIDSSEIHQNVEALEQTYDCISHSSSLSEESESIYVEKEELKNFVEGKIRTEEPSILAQPSQRESRSNNATPLTVDTTHKGPVYDLSPRTSFENRSMSSITFDPQVVSELDSSAIVVKRAVSFSERVKQLGSSDVDIDAIVDKAMLANRSKKPPVDKSEMTSVGVSNPSHKDHQRAFEPSVVFQECVSEVSNGEQDSNSAAVPHAGLTNEDRSAEDIQNVDTFEDVGSDQGESDVKEPMQNAPEDTGFDGSDVRVPDISSSSSSSSSFSSYASVSDSDKG